MKVWKSRCKNLHARLLTNARLALSCHYGSAHSSRTLNIPPAAGRCSLGNPAARVRHLPLTLFSNPIGGSFMLFSRPAALIIDSRKLRALVLPAVLFSPIVPLHLLAVV